MPNSLSLKKQPFPTRTTFHPSNYSKPDTRVHPCFRSPARASLQLPNLWLWTILALSEVPVLLHSLVHVGSWPPCALRLSLLLIAFINPSKGSSISFTRPATPADNTNLQKFYFWILILLNDYSLTHSVSFYCMHPVWQSLCQVMEHNSSKDK